MKIPFADRVHKGFWTVLDWIYPPVCAGCGEPGQCLCLNCQAKINYIGKKQCAICGEPFVRGIGLCRKCQTDRPPFTAIRNLARYEGVVRECIHALKYENNHGLANFYTGRLASIVLDAGWEIDLVLPVPLSHQRIKERGYNQSARIARPLAKHLQISYSPYGLKRVRDTRSQVGLSAEDRHQNVAGAFSAISEMVCGKRVLLVDDVMTTGSTIEACANALNSAGAQAVYGLTLARFSSHIPEIGELSNHHQV